MTSAMQQDIISMAVALVLALGGELLRRYGRKRQKAGAEGRFARLAPKLGTALSIIGAWLFVSQLLPMIFGPIESEGLKVEISPGRRLLFGLSISESVITTWIAMACILALALAARIFVIPKMKRVPTGAQNALEILVESIDNYAKSQAGGLGENLSAYLLSVALLLIGCAAVELFGVRPPLADITMTFALALITFVLINYYGIKRKGVVGRVKALGEQGPVVLVLRVISDCAIPVSMACRLFGNMLGGMIVMDLLYNALGSRAIGIPSVLGLYFNVFHPLIQGFIFITLTLTFINEAIE